MKRATVLFCLAISTSYAGISNQQPTHIQVKAKSAAKHVSSKKFSSISKESLSSSSSSSSSSSESISEKKEPQPLPITQLVIKNAKPAKKTHSKSSTNLKRGRRGPPGKKGKRGKKGKQGEPGQPAVSALSSGITNQQASLAANETVKSFTQTNALSIYYTPATGIFTSEAGPGHYEIHYGGNWTGDGVLALFVDGVELSSSANTTWARETIIINTNAQAPTFSLANSQASKGSISCTSAFLTIKKIQ